AAKHQNVRPAVAVKIVHIAEHRVGGAWLGREWVRWIKLMRDGELRTLIPKRTGDDIHFSIVIDVPRDDAIAEVFAVKNAFFEMWRVWQSGRQRPALNLKCEKAGQKPR